MIDLSHLRGKTIAVLGLGKSGLASVKALINAGAVVWAWDDNASSREQIEPLGLVPINLNECDWTEPDMLVISPGIPSTFPTPHPAAEKARRAGKPIICDVELLCIAQPDVPTLAITGTNGKSTTTALTAHIIAEAGIKTQAGGNLGNAALGLEPSTADDCLVLELSSYQLELMAHAQFDACALLNITPDHLDRHGGLDGYIGAKRQIFARAKGPKWAIISVDDEPCARMAVELAREGGRHIIEVSVKTPVDHGIYVDHEGWLIDDTTGANTRILDLNTVTHMPGRHNWQNIAFAYGLCRARGVDATRIIDGVMSFPGLAHRQERLGDINGVVFVNDSKATNAEASAKALSAYRNIYWIVGGKPKEGGIAGLEEFYPNIKKAYLIGAATNEFAIALDGDLSWEKCETLDVATKAAFEDANTSGDQNPVVMLTPACASFDQFKSFEARGDAFRDLYAQLADANGASAGKAST